MICGAVDHYLRGANLTGDTRHVGEERIFGGFVQVRDPIFCAEDDMREKVGVRMAHCFVPTELGQGQLYFPTGSRPWLELFRRYAALSVERTAAPRLSVERRPLRGGREAYSTQTRL